MAVFNSECVETANGVETSVIPEGEAGVPGGTQFLLDWDVSRDNASRRGFRPAHDAGANFGVNSGNRKAFVNAGGECFLQHAELFWFGHLHIIPTSFELGNVLTTQFRTYEYFNAFRFEDKTLVTLNRVGDSGFLYTGELDEESPPRSPRIIKALETIVVDVSVSPNGPVNIAASVQYTFDGGEFLQITFSGSRVVIMTQEPQSRVNQEYKFLTDIIEFSAGEEQRISVADVPRETLTYRFVNTDEDMAWLENQVWGWMENTWGLPNWLDYTVLTSDVTIGDSTIFLEDTTKRDFRAAADGSTLALIWQDKFTFEAVGVSSFTDTSLSTFQPVTQNHPAGSIVMPLRLGQMFKPTREVWSQTEAKQIELAWRMRNNVADPGGFISPEPFLSENPFYTPSGESVGYPVWNLYLDGAELVIEGNNYRVTHDKDLRPFPSDISKPYTSTPKKQTLATLQGFRICGYGRDELQRMKQWLFYLRGKQKAFWMTTGRDDFVLFNPATALSTTLDIEPVNYTNQVFGVINGPRNRQDIVILYQDGTQDFRRISNAVDNDTFETITIAGGGISQDSTNIVSISYLTLRRLNVDNYAFTHFWYEGEWEIPISLQEVVQEGNQ